MSLINEQAFDEIFDRDGNKQRLADYEAKQGPWIMRFEYNGAEQFAIGQNKTECRQLALLKTGGDDYEKATFERCGK